MLYSTETGPVPLIDIRDEEQNDILIENAKQQAELCFGEKQVKRSLPITAFPF